MIYEYEHGELKRVDEFLCDLYIDITDSSACPRIFNFFSCLLYFVYCVQ